MNLPNPPAHDAVLTIEQYGMLLFRFVLADSANLATLSDHQVQTAAYASTRVIACPRGLYSDTVYAALCNTDRLIQACARRRTAEQARTQVPTGVTPERPNMGPMARLEPAPISRPPSPTYARVDTVEF